MDNQNEGQRDVSGVEITAWAWANAYLENSKKELNHDAATLPGVSIEILALHATLQQREKHHIEFIECFKVFINEVNARGKEVSLELDLLTQGVEGIKDKIQGLQLSIEGVIESIDFANTKPVVHWMESNVAAKDKAREIGLDVPIEWTPADLRYKLHQAIYGGDNG